MSLPLMFLAQSIPIVMMRNKYTTAISKTYDALKIFEVNVPNHQTRCGQTVGEKS